MQFFPAMAITAPPLYCKIDWVEQQLRIISIASTWVTLKSESYHFTAQFILKLNDWLITPTSPLTIAGSSNRTESIKKKLLSYICWSMSSFDIIRKKKTTERNKHTRKTDSIEKQMRKKEGEKRYTSGSSRDRDPGNISNAIPGCRGGATRDIFSSQQNLFFRKPDRKPIRMKTKRQLNVIKITQWKESTVKELWIALRLQ